MKLYVISVVLLGMIFLTGCIPTTIPMINARAHTELTIQDKGNMTGVTKIAYNDGNHLVIDDKWVNNTLVADYETDGWNLTSIQYIFYWNGQDNTKEEFWFFRNGTVLKLDAPPGTVRRLVVTNYTSKFEIRKDMVNWTIVN